MNSYFTKRKTNGQLTYKSYFTHYEVQIIRIIEIICHKKTDRKIKRLKKIMCCEWKKTDTSHDVYIYVA